MSRVIDFYNNYDNNVVIGVDDNGVIFRQPLLPTYAPVEDMIKTPMPFTPIPLYKLPDGTPVYDTYPPFVAPTRGIDQMPRNPIRKPRQFDVNAKRPYAVNGRKVRNFVALTTDEIRCNARQAPSGYHYGTYNGVCVLMTADNKPVQTVAASQADTQVNTVQGMGAGLVSNIQAMVSNNPLLVLAAVGGVIYFATKK